MAPKAVSVWMTREVFSFPEEAECLCSGLRPLWLLFCLWPVNWAMPVTGARHRCSAQPPPPCLLPVYSVFLPLFTGSDPIGATLSQPWQDVLWDGTGDLVPPARLVLWMVLALSCQCHLLSVPILLPQGPCDWALYTFNVGFRTPGPLFTQDYKPTLLSFILVRGGGGRQPTMLSLNP